MFTLFVNFRAYCKFMFMMQSTADLICKDNKRNYSILCKFVFRLQLLSCFIECLLLNERNRKKCNKKF